MICEKPLARTLAEAERMLAAVRKAGVPNMVCHNYRRAPAVMLAHQLIAEGTLGQIRHFRGTYLQDWLVDPNAPRSWRLDRAKAGPARSATSDRTSSISRGSSWARSPR